MRFKTMKNALLLIALCAGLSMTACNTVKGVGQDIQKAGESIENAVKKK